MENSISIGLYRDSSGRLSKHILNRLAASVAKFFKTNFKLKITMTDLEIKMQGMAFRESAINRANEYEKIPKMIIEEWACLEILPKYKRLAKKLDKELTELSDEPDLYYQKKAQYENVAFLVSELERLIRIHRNN